MKITVILFTLFCSCFCLFGAIEQSILPQMDSLIITDLEGKIPPAQKEELDALMSNADKRLRVVSFNMLFNHYWSEKSLDWVNRWKTRKSRVIEYVQETQADIIGSQELQQNQIDDLMAALGNEYCYYGKGTTDGDKKGDVAAIFYRPERVELLEGNSYYYSETPTVPSTSPFRQKNTYAVCLFKDRLSGQQFRVINTHLAFGNVARREYETEKLREFISEHVDALPLFVTGDFNSFPFRQDLDIPFFDGDRVVKTIETASVRDSRAEAAFGHFGPLSSTNFCTEEKRAFCSEGTPGVILDHIFVNDQVTVLAHGIDPARVNGLFPSDHFPVIVDILFSQQTQTSAH